MDCANTALPPSPPTLPQSHHYIPQPSEWSLFEPATKQGSTCSSNSSDSGYESEGSPTQYSPIEPKAYNFYGNILPINHDKAYYGSSPFAPSVAAY